MSAEGVRAAYVALSEGNVDPLVSLMSEDMEWRGVTNGWRFWRPVPS
ncbi:MAG TPA: hypothetical protein VFJ93_02310 [Gaiellaceae bacterium]|nr:hypothetical protein [Gaiellaceae bacterium]